MLHVHPSLGSQSCLLCFLPSPTADLGLSVYMSSFITVDGVWLGTTKTRANSAIPSAIVDGHKGISVDRSNDVLVSNFRLAAKFYHDVSVSYYTTQSVFSNGYGDDLNIDFHRASPFSNLYTQVSECTGAGFWYVQLVWCALVVHWWGGLNGWPSAGPRVAASMSRAIHSSTPLCPNPSPPIPMVPFVRLHAVRRLIMAPAHVSWTPAARMTMASRTLPHTTHCGTTGGASISTGPPLMAWAPTSIS